MSLSVIISDGPRLWISTQVCGSRCDRHQTSTYASKRLEITVYATNLEEVQINYLEIVSTLNCLGLETTRVFSNSHDLFSISTSVATNERLTIQVILKRLAIPHSRVLVFFWFQFSVWIKRFYAQGLTYMAVDEAIARFTWIVNVQKTILRQRCMALTMELVQRLPWMHTAS